MQVLIFRTNIDSEGRLRHIRPLFVNHPKVSEWSVDMEDCDHVLRIVCSKTLNEGHIIYLVNFCGYRCELLND